MCSNNYQSSYCIYKWDTSSTTSPKGVAHGYWNNLTKQREFVENLSKKLNISSKEGWYAITKATVQQHGGYGLLQKHNGSVSKLLSIVPEYQQACRESVLAILQDLKLHSVQDIFTVSKEYPGIILLQLTNWTIVSL